MFVCLFPLTFQQEYKFGILTLFFFYILYIYSAFFRLNTDNNTLIVRLLPTVANNSYHFWADLVNSWLFLGRHPWLYPKYTFWAKSHDFSIMENGKFTQLYIQHLLKLADVQSIKGTCFNKCCITEWIFHFPLAKIMRFSPWKSG